MKDSLLYWFYRIATMGLAVLMLAMTWIVWGAALLIVGGLTHWRADVMLAMGLAYLIGVFNTAWRDAMKRDPLPSLRDMWRDSA